MKREWMPSHLMDEVVPPPRATPTDWIIGPAGDRWLIAGWEDCDEEATAVSRRTLAPGDILDFDWNEIGPTFEVVIHADGRAELTQGGEPPPATHYWVQYDPDTMGFGWDEFVRNYADNLIGESELVEVQAYSWSEKHIPHRLVVENGAARFEPAEDAG